MAGTDREELKRKTLQAKALLQEQIKNEQQQKKDEASAKAAQERMAKIDDLYKSVLAASKKVGAGKDKESADGRPRSLWQVSDDHTKELLKSGVAAYDDLRAAFTKLWDGYVALAMAVSQSIEEKLYIPVGYRIAMGAEQGWQRIQQVAKIPIFQDIIQRAKKIVTTEPDALLPVLNSYVECNEQNELVVNSVMRDDDGQLQHGFDDVFRDNVVAWLGDQGYTPRNQTNVFVNGSGEELTSEKLKELQSDPENGLSKFLSAQYDGLSFKM